MASVHVIVFAASDSRELNHWAIWVQRDKKQCWQICPSKGSLHHLVGDTGRYRYEKIDQFSTKKTWWWHTMLVLDVNDDYGADLIELMIAGVPIQNQRSDWSCHTWVLDVFRLMLAQVLSKDITASYNGIMQGTTKMLAQFYGKTVNVKALPR
jgi:hypothetical protein